ncbi:MAG: MFS transporter [Oscillospiraceae bacterium]|nr:MFS transporter [Oscillospiraceae bacterium]
MSKTREELDVKDRQELEQRQKQLDKHEYKGYLWVLCIVIVLVHVIDEIASNTASMVESNAIKQFFPNLDLSTGKAAMTAISSPLGMISMLMPFYKALSDKYGRKVFLVLNTLGFSLGMIIAYFSNSIVGYLIGTTIITFFIAHDLQVVYIQESAPPKYRATIYAVTKGIGTFGMFAIPLLRRFFVDRDASLWKNVYLIPGLCGVGIALLTQFLTKESKVFLEQRVNHLQQPYEVRHPEKKKLTKEEKKAQKTKANKSGVFAAISYLFNHNKDLMWTTISIITFAIGMTGIAMNINVIMATGMTEQEITNAQSVYAFGYAIIVIIFGLIGDNLGRKTTVLLTGIMSIVTFVLFVFGVRNHWNSYLIGVLYSGFLGGYWTAQDYMVFMASEKVPTKIRGSVLGGLNLLQYIGIAVGTLMLTIAQVFITDDMIGIACAISAIPGMIVAMYFILKNTKETKGADFEALDEEAEALLSE